MSQPVLRRLALIVAIASLLVSGVSASGPGTTRTSSGSSDANRHTNATYDVNVGLDGEIYPVFANYASLRRVRERTWGTVAVRVTNSGPEPLRDRITVQIPGWSDQEIQLAEMSGGESHTFLFAPAFYPRLYQNHEILAATAVVTIANQSGAIVDEQTVPIRLRSADDLYWGRDFEYAPFIASWVTPHDPAVEKLLSRAKEFAVGRRLPGYESAGLLTQERSTLMQVRAIYRALQEHGVSYVKSSLTLGRHEEVSERVRMPAESLNEISANCIDGAVMYASMFENLGMDPEIVLVPGHAFVAVRLAPNSHNYLYIETSLTGRASFSKSVASAQRGLARVPKSEVMRISIRKARLDGIYPMPSVVSPRQKDLLEAGRKPPHSGS